MALHTIRPELSPQDTNIWFWSSLSLQLWVWILLSRVASTLLWDGLLDRSPQAFSCTIQFSSFLSEVPSYWFTVFLLIFIYKWWAFTLLISLSILHGFSSLFSKAYVTGMPYSPVCNYSASPESRPEFSSFVSTHICIPILFVLVNRSIKHWLLQTPQRFIDNIHDTRVSRVTSIRMKWNVGNSWVFESWKRKQPLWGPLWSRILIDSVYWERSQLWLSRHAGVCHSDVDG